MSALIKFELKELRQLSNDKKSCIVEKTVTHNIALPPWCLGNLKESIKKTFDYKLGKSDEVLNGILLTYKNLRIVQNVGAMRNENADLHFQVQADYFIFQPHVGATFKGIVTKKSVTHLGVLLYRVFNIVIPRPTEKLGNAWIGLNIQENQEVLFKIAVLDLYGALPYIRGEIDARSYHKFIKVGQGGEGGEETIKLDHIKPIGSAFNLHKTNLSPGQTDNISIPPIRNFMSSNVQSAKNNGIIGYKSAQRQSTGEKEVNDYIKKKRKNKSLSSTPL